MAYLGDFGAESGGFCARLVGTRLGAVHDRVLGGRCPPRSGRLGGGGGGRRGVGDRLGMDGDKTKQARVRRMKVRMQ
jgi:hypothetical protein